MVVNKCEIDLKNINGIFHPSVLNIACDNLKCRISAFSLKTEKINIPLIILIKKNKVIEVPSFQYTGFCPIKEDIKGKSYERHWFEIIKTLKEHLPRHGSFLIHPFYHDLRPFIWNKFKVDILYTYRAYEKWNKDLITHEEKKHIKKVLKNDIRIDNYGKTDQMIDLLFNSYSRHNRKPPYEREYLFKLVERLEELKYLKIRAAYYNDDKLIAFRAMINGEKECFDWIAGSTENGLKTGANSYLLYSCIKEETGNGKTVDLCGANTLSIARFKSGFNVELVQYARISW